MNVRAGPIQPQRERPAPGRRKLQLVPAEQTADGEFQLAAADILEKPLAPLRSFFLWTICALFVFGVVGASIAKVDVFAIAAGRIQSVGRSKVIQPTDTGRVTVVHVTDGTHVRAGDVLVELDPTETSADREQHALELQAYEAELARRGAAEVVNEKRLHAGMPDIHFDAHIDPAIRARETAVLRSELASLRAQVDSLDAKIGETLARRRTIESQLIAQRELIRTLQERYDMRAELAGKQWETAASVIDAKEALARERASVVENEGQVVQADAAVASFEREKDAAIAKYAEENSRARAEKEGLRDGVNQLLIKTSARAERTRLTAPVSGVVQDLAVTTLGQVVTAGQQLMTIVPEGTALEIEALVLNRDIGFVEEGQTAVVKVDTFPFTIYGSLSARVTRVSRDAVDGQSRTEALPTAAAAIQPVRADQTATSRTAQTQELVFPITLVLDETMMRVNGKHIPLSPGMTVNVEVKTAKRRVIQYLLAPMAKLASEAGHER